MTAANGNGSSSSHTIQSHPRHAYTKAILGEDLFAKLSSSKILVVGAGGIGCEVLKNLAMIGAGEIEVIDLDTIDLSNLNRQFLFTKAHISKPKSLIASSTANQFNPLVHIKPYHADVMNTSQFGWEFFERFDVVLNALDNLKARRWVNRMCIMTGIPLVESGTAGFLGQVQPIMKGVTECYDCTPKPTTKTYPTCTIRSTPSAPIHCVVWAKTWLFSQLFGAEDENDDAELDKALKDGENADEIANLREQAREMGAIRQAVLSVKEDATTEELQAVCRRTFNKIFKEDVERLLSMDGMWRKRVRPIPIEYDAASQEEESSSSALPTNGSNGNQLKDQKLLSLKETVELFDESLVALANRARANPGEPITFDKDELDTLNFVTATANLRSRIYHIAPQTRFQVKEMAGNIIPAIASTNAIIAGAQMFQLLQSFRHAWKEARFVSLNKMNPSRLVTSFACSKPSVECGVCQDDYVRAALDVSKVTLGELKEAVLQSKEEGGLGYQVEGLEIFESSRLLADEDFDDNLQKVLHEMKIEEGTMITCVDEDGAFCSVNVIIAAPASNAAASIDFRSKNSFQLREKVKIGKPAEEESDEEDIVEVVEAPIATKSTPAIKRKRSAEEDSVEAVADAEANFKRKKLSKQSGNGEEEAIELD